MFVFVKKRKGRVLVCMIPCVEKFAVVVRVIKMDSLPLSSSLII